MYQGQWFKSSFSGNNNGDCVEVSFAVVDGRDVVRVRDSKDGGAGPVLVLDLLDWQLLLTEVLQGATVGDGPVAIVANDWIRSYPGRGSMRTSWQLRSVGTGETLYFDDAEWAAFRSGVAAGEFTPPRMVAATRK